MLTTDAIDKAGIKNIHTTGAIDRAGINNILKVVMGPFMV